MTRPRLPLLLYSYLANELLAPFFASFIILYSVFFLIRLIPLLEVVLNLGIGLADFIRLFSYIFPHMLLYVIPMASMTGVILGFTRLTNDREILALKACGVGLRQMLPPVICVAAAIALLTGYFSLRLIPAGELAAKQLMFQLAKEKIDKGLKAKEFTETLGDLVVYVDEIDKEKNWHGVYVSDMRGRQQPLITMAKSGRMTADVEKMVVVIVLNDGTLHNAEENKDNQVIRFERYQLQIPLRPPTRIDGEDVTYVQRGAMTQDQLLQAATTFGPDNKKGIIYLTEYHHRLAMPVGCLILSLLGLPLGLQAGPGRKAIGIPLGLTFFVLYYVTFTTFRVMTEDLALPLVVGMWMPNLIFLTLALYIFFRVDQERTILPNRVQLLLAGFYDRFLRRWWERVQGWCRRQIEKRTLHRRSIAAATEPAGLPIHGDATTHLFHLPECEQYARPDHRMEFKDITTAREAGFEPCQFCKTLLERKEP